MRRFIYLLLCLLLTLLALSWIAWENKARVAAHLISSHLHAPATIQTLNIEQTHVDIDSFWVGMPRSSHSNTSFSAETIDIDMNVTQVLSNPLVIEQIAISDIFVGLEYYKNGQTNWNYMLGDSSKKSSKKGRDYLIRTLILENLTVEVTQANGSKKRYPTIPRMEFHNISSDTGFPIKEIEKAIFDLMMKQIFDKFNLLKQLPVPQNSPLKGIPNLFK